LNLPSLHNLALLRNPVHDSALARIDERYLMSDQADEILTVDEVATFLKAGKRTVYRLAANGTIPAFKLGGTWRFRREDLNAWIKSRTVYAVSEKAKGANNQ
jgi:excisionase family DNA binding protein